jgi:hypothetical protein
MILSGTLLMPTGQPLKNAFVRLVAKSTSEQVLKTTSGGFSTDDDGEYSVDCPFGNYAVVLFGSNGNTTIGSIVIDENTTETNINALILLGDVAASNPILQEIRQAVIDAEAAATSAEQSADYTEGLLSTKVSITDLTNSSDASKGATGVGWSRQALSSSTDFKTVSANLGTQWVCITEFAHLITSKPTLNDMTTWDWTPAIQGTIDYAKALGSVSYGGYGVSIPAGVFPVTRIVHKSGVPIKGMGSRSTFLTALPFDPANGFPYGLLEIDNGPVQGAGITGVNFCGSASATYGSAAVNANQWGFYCHAKYDAGNVQGGFWHSQLIDVTFWNFNFGVWSRGGYTAANSRRPNQFLDFIGCQVVVQDGGTPYLFTGQHGQINVINGHGEGISAGGTKLAQYSAKITFDPNPATTAVDGINGESTSDTAGVGNANRSGHNITFSNGYSFQRARKGIWVVGAARNISINACWFETTAQAVTAEAGANISLSNNRFANAGIGTTGGIAGSGYILSLAGLSQIDYGFGNVCAGSYDAFVSPTSSGANECNGFNFVGDLNQDTTGTTILPTLPQKSLVLDASGVVNIGTHRFATISANTDKTIRLSKLSSNCLPGNVITLRAASGTITIKNSAGGNFVTGSGKDITIPSGGIATFLRIQPYVSGSEFLLTSVSQHYASAVPADGFHYTQGHIVHNIATGAGVPSGWVCTTAGLAGTTAVFKALANLI